MKKLLIATAALAMVAGTAQAQSSVTVYGVVDAGITDTTVDKTSSAGVVTSRNDKTTGNGSAYTSQRLGFRGTEDLGGGLKANFVYEFGLADTDGATAGNVDSGTDAAGNITTRVATVGLSGAFGALDIGRQNVIADKAWGVGDVGGANNFIGRAYTSSGKLNNSRSDRLINYVSPNFSGFTVHVAYGERNNENIKDFAATAVTAASTPSSSKETGLGLQYSAGALNAFLGYSKEEVRRDGARLIGSTSVTAATATAAEVSTSANKVGSDPKQYVLGANYDFKMAKAFVTYATAEDTNELGNKINDKKVTELGLAIPFGKTTLQLSMFDGENKATTTTKNDINGYQVGVLHAFSKRTTGYVVYGSAEDKLQGATTATETEQFGFGVRHAF
jgi:GBP family porin